MFCYNCGNNIDGYERCPYCGADVYDENAGYDANDENCNAPQPGGDVMYDGNQYNYDGNVYTDEYEENYQNGGYEYPESNNNYREYEQAYGGNSREYNRPQKSNALFYTMASFMSVIIIALLVFIIIFTVDSKKRESFSDVKAITSSGSSLKFNIDSYDADSDTDSETVGGSVSSGDTRAYLVINGERIKTFEPNTKNESWSYDLSLKSGENQFAVTLYDEEGNSKSKKIVINYSDSLTYPKGTVFVKNVNDGVYIRNTPQISKDYLMLIPKEDTTSIFVCVGEESTDDDGYVWCKIKTEDGLIGWVRSDLMKTV